MITEICSAYDGCCAGWTYTQMHITTIGNTVRLSIMPTNRKLWSRSMKSIMNTMESTDTVTWRCICGAKVSVTAAQQYINIWTGNWIYALLSAPKRLAEERESLIKHLKTNLNRILLPRSRIKNGALISRICFWRTGAVRYNCTIIDLHERSVVSSITDRQITSDLAIRTLQKALDSQPQRKEGLILHSDQGSQYTSKAFVEFCESMNITQSMSKAGYPYDNAPMERYFNTLKNECINLYEFRTEEELYRAVEEFAYITYNHVRPHSYNDYCTPYQKRIKG